MPNYLPTKLWPWAECDRGDGPIKQTQDLTEMLEYGLELEKRACSSIPSSMTSSKGRINPAFLLEQQILDEQGDVEEFERFLRLSKLQAVRVARAA